MASAARLDRWGLREGGWRDLFLTPRLTAGLAAALALGIFIVDVATPAEFAVAVLYVMVVLLVGSAYRRRVILAVAVSCIVLTMLSFGLTHTLAADRNAVFRCIMSLAAIVVTTALVLRNEAVTAALAERVRLLDLTHDTVSARSMANVITYWNKGAEELYGWPRGEAVGRVVHDLLRTEFSAPSQEIMAEFLRTGRWEGELVHRTRSGGRVDVASRWYLQRDRLGQPVSILETNNDIGDRKLAEAAALRHQQELQLIIDFDPGTRLDDAAGRSRRLCQRAMGRDRLLEGRPAPGLATIGTSRGSGSHGIPHARCAVDRHAARGRVSSATQGWQLSLAPRP